MNTALTADQQAAADELFARRRDGRAGPRLPQAQRPQDLAAALALQNAVIERFKASGERVGGWKCGPPSADRLMIGPIFASQVFRQDSPVKVIVNDRIYLEPEIGYVFGKALPPRAAQYTPEEVMAAVAARHCTLEICASRYNEATEPPFPEMLADGLSNQGIIIGDAWAADAVIPREYTLRLEADGQLLKSYDAKHIAGDPQLPLYWLANHLSAQGLGIEAGQVVITGSHAGLIEAPVNQALRFDYGGLKAASATMIPI